MLVTRRVILDNIGEHETENTNITGNLYTFTTPCFYGEKKTSPHITMSQGTIANVASPSTPVESLNLPVISSTWLNLLISSSPLAKSYF